MNIETYPPHHVSQSRLILRSFARLLGRELLDATDDDAENARRLFEAPFVVVSHGIQTDPIFNYANRAALALFEYPVEQFITLPSRLSAEPLHRDERARLLERTARDGFVDDYQGIRITRTGRRFHIPRAIVWNLLHDDGRYAGQAATFSEYTILSAGANPAGQHSA